MKDWLTIGQFSKEVGVSTKALRLYEKLGLVESHVRGDNGYRYYKTSQLELALRLKELKDLGFSLVEIKSLLQADRELDFEKIVSSMRSRLQLISMQVEHLSSQSHQIQNILNSLKSKTEPLKAQQRRAIMSFYGQVSIVVTGHSGLEKTAAFIQQHFRNAGHSVPIVRWRDAALEAMVKPYILIVSESELASSGIENIHPDVVVIKGLGNTTEKTAADYLKLYSEVGPHVNTVVNADDRASVELAGNTLLKKGRIFYYSKNRGLEGQIKNIGGIVSDGEDVEIYGFNLKPETVHLKLGRILAFEDEIALLSSFGAVLTVGLEQVHLQSV